MARQYSPTQFFRRVPNTLLQRYFQEKQNVLHEINFEELKETNVDSIFQAFITLPPQHQSKIEAEFQEIDTMACQGGVTTLIDEALFHQDTNITEALSKINGFHGKVMWVFIEHPEYWAGATLFLHSDNISEFMWKKRNCMSSNESVPRVNFS
jgi:hypothetical protein